VGFSLQSLTRTAGIKKHPDEIKHPGFAYLLLIMAFTYQLATGLERQRQLHIY
jgi:hypothetical protein